MRGIIQRRTLTPTLPEGPSLGHIFRDNATDLEKRKTRFFLSHGERTEVRGIIQPHRFSTPFPLTPPSPRQAGRGSPSIQRFTRVEYRLTGSAPAGGGGGGGNTHDVACQLEPTNQGCEALGFVSLSPPGRVGVRGNGVDKRFFLQLSRHTRTFQAARRDLRPLRGT